MAAALDHLLLLEGEVLAMAAALGTHDPDQPVVACPGWTLRDVTGHLIGVHTWARAALDSPGPPPYDEPRVEGGADELARAYEQAAAALMARLRELPPSAPAWTFDKTNRTAGFWSRRQVHEVALHRWDVAPYVLGEALARDGIDEVLTFFAPRQVSRGLVPPGRLELCLPDEMIGFGQGEVTRVEGTCADVLLRLWGRGEPLPDGWAGLTP